MLKNVIAKGTLVTALSLMCASAASAQDLGRQTVNFTFGYFTPLAPDARDVDDVLNVNTTYLLFDIDEFDSGSIGGEWLFPLARHLEGGIGVNFTSQTVPSVYQDFVDPNGTEIFQELRLRTVPIAFTARFIPTGPRSIIQPYFGGGLGLINWRYSEIGEFIDFSAGNEIFDGRFVNSGASVGPILLGGIRFAGDTASGGFEIKYQRASGDLDEDFAAPKIDLGGWTYNFTVGFRF